MSDAIPSHVPPELIRDFNIFTSPGMELNAGGCPFKAMTKLREEPRIFYVPNPGRGRDGNWVVTSAEDMRAVLQNPELFSSNGVAGFSQLLGERWDLLPLEADPPKHAKYRALLEPEMTVKKMDALVPAIEGYADALLDEVKGRPGCEFVKSFAQRFPVMVFLKLLGLPDSQLEIFAAWAWGLLHGPSLAEQAAAAQAIKDHMLEAMKEASTKPVNSTLLSRIVHGEIEGVPLNDDEKLGYAFLVFLAGLDTVASSLAFYFRHLAENQEFQARLRANPELISTAIDELLRMYSVVTTSRRVTKDTELAGATLKAGDWISLSLVLGNRDPREYVEPDEVRLDRGNKPHFTFGAGKHRCMGSHLARVEMAIFMRKFFDAIPTFRLAPHTQPLVHGAGVFGIKELQLVWD
jgi:cytochrome P450